MRGFNLVGKVSLAVLSLSLILGINSAIVQGASSSGDFRWFLLKTTAYVRAAQPDEKIVYAVHDTFDLSEVGEVEIKSGEKVTWDTSQLEGGLSGSWGWKIEIRATQNSVIRISIGTNTVKSSFLGPFIFSYEFSRDKVYSEEYSVGLGQKVYSISSPVSHEYTFNSFEGFFSSGHESIYLSIEVIGEGDVYILVNSENSLFYVV
jgi:hypothetical protein